MIHPPESLRQAALCVVFAPKQVVRTAWLMTLLVMGFGVATLTAQPLAAPRERMAWLAAEIARHDELYFKQAAPEISDAGYDALKRELRALQAAHPELAPTGGGLGDDRSGRFPVRRHRERILGLDKSYTLAELTAFVEKAQRQLAPAAPVFVIEPKFDGLAISVTFVGGRLTQAVTRGNGIEGDDVTANLLALSDVPRALTVGSGPVPAVLELRGEVYLTWAEFRRINRERAAAGVEPYAHPRNLAVGTLKQSDGALEADRRLAVVFYGIGACAPEAARPVSQQALLRSLRAWGLPVVENARLARDGGEVWAAVQAIGSGRTQLGFPIDGAVVKVDDAAQQQKLGDGPEAPLWAMAYKFPSTRAATQVTGITWQIGRTGVLTPVAEFVPVKLAGSTVRRASLHNRREIERQDIRVGDWVWLEKAGEIIPAIVAVDRARRPAEARVEVPPQQCPGCGTALTAETTALRCPNYDCPAQLQRRLEYFVSDGAVDIDGVGPALIAALVERKRLAHPADFYALRREDLLEVAAPKTADKVLTAIAASRQRALWRFVCGLGVPDVGPAAAKTVARHFPDLTAWARAGEADYAGSQVSASARRAALHFFAASVRCAEAEQLQRALQAAP